MIDLAKAKILKPGDEAVVVATLSITESIEAIAHLMFDVIEFDPFVRERTGHSQMWKMEVERHCSICQKPLIEKMCFLRPREFMLTPLALERFVSRAANKSFELCHERLGFR